jgi:hypothetical protein
MEALGSEIGSLNITKKTAGEITQYQHKTLIEVDLFVKKISVLLQNDMQYRSGQLMTVKSQATVNGKPHSSSLIEWKNGAYSIQVDGETKPSWKSPIRFSGTLLYFQEPVGIKEAFSEASAVFMQIKPLGKSSYQLVDPENGRKMLHYYENGTQTKVEIKHPVVTLTLTRQDPVSHASN